MAAGKQSFRRPIMVIRGQKKNQWQWLEWIELTFLSDIVFKSSLFWLARIDVGRPQSIPARLKERAPKPLWDHLPAFPDAHYRNVICIYQSETTSEFKVICQKPKFRLSCSSEALCCSAWCIMWRELLAWPVYTCHLPLLIEINDPHSHSSLYSAPQITVSLHWRWARPVLILETTQCGPAQWVVTPKS